MLSPQAQLDPSNPLEEKSVPFSIRISNEADLERIRGFFSQFVAETNVVRKEEYLLAAIRDRRVVWLEDKRDGSVVGMIARYVYHLSNNKTCHELGSLIISDRGLGKGFVNALMTAQMALAIGKETRKPDLFVSGVFEDNNKVLKKFQQAGWAEIPQNSLFVQKFLETCVAGDYRTVKAMSSITWFCFFPQALALSDGNINPFIEYPPEIYKALVPKNFVPTLGRRIFSHAVGGSDAISHKV